MPEPLLPSFTWRDRLAGRMANLSLRVGTRRYRAVIAGAIRYGMDAAARDVREGRDCPPPWDTSVDGPTTRALDRVKRVQALRREAERLGFLLVQHQRSRDGDDKPLGYCGACFQDWPCKGYQACQNDMTAAENTDA